MTNPPFKRRVRYVKAREYLDRFADASLLADEDLTPLPPRKENESDQDVNGMGPLFASTFPTPNFGLRFTDKGAGEVRLTETYSGLTPTPTFTRATTATTVLASGLVASVASGSPRSYYDPTSLAYLGYLAEGARTNLLLQSQTFTNASWVKTDTTPTQVTTGPDGVTNSASLMTEGSAGTANTAQNVTATANVTYAVSLWAKPGTLQWLRVTVLNGANQFTKYFDIQNGVVGTTANSGTGVLATASITSYPSSWKRITITGVVMSAATDIQTLVASATADNNATRVSGSTYSLYGAQFEDNVSFSSTYMPTTVASFTRNADVLTYPLTGWYNQATGTFFAQFATLGAADAAAAKSAFSVNDNSTNEDMKLDLSTAIASRFTVTDGGVTQAAITIGGAVTAGVMMKSAGAYAVNDFSAAKDGVLGTPDVSGSLPTPTQAMIGALGTGVGQLYGPISSIAYWCSAFPQADLKTITGPNFSL